MNCPSCNAEVADGTTICPNCDHILDTSFLSSEPPERDDVGDTADKTPPPRAAVGRADSSPSRSRPPPTRAQPPPGGDDGATQIKSMGELQQDRERRRTTGSAPRPAAGRRPSMPDAPPRPAPRPREERDESWRAAAEEPAAHAHDDASLSIDAGSPEDAIEQVKEFVRDLNGADKLAVVGAGLTILMCFFPWKETAADGDALGLLSLGFPVFVTSIGTIAAVALRIRAIAKRQNVLLPLLGQLGASAFSVLWCLVFIAMSWNTKMARSPIGNFELRTSMPSWGVFAALLTAVVTLAGTVMGLREKPS